MKNSKFFFTNLSFVLLFILLSTNLFSQTSIYKPFHAYGIWILETYGPTGPGYENTIPNTGYSRFEANGDTTISGYTYKKVTVASTAFLPTASTYGPSSFCFAYRNDTINKKVFIYANVSGQYKDTLWYDFNLNTGDTLKETYALDVNNVYYDRRIVASIDSVLICGIYHKKFNFICSDYSTPLVEGVGFVDNFLNTTPMCPFEPVFLYTTSFYCTLTSVNNLSETSINQIEIFPNPVTNSLQFNCKKQNLVFPLEYSIIDCLGKTIRKGSCTERKNIDVGVLKSGIYFLQFKDKQGCLYQRKFVKE